VARGWGGARPNTGPKANPYRTAKLSAAIIEKAKHNFGDSVRPNPLEYLLAVMWSETESPATRFEAAKAAAPFCHPKMMAVNVEAQEDNRLVIEFRDFRKSSRSIGQEEPLQQIATDGSVVSTPVLDQIIDTEHNVVVDVIRDEVSDQDDLDDAADEPPTRQWEPQLTKPRSTKR
jgi:hypothetical protein